MRSLQFAFFIKLCIKLCIEAVVTVFLACHLVPFELPIQQHEDQALEHSRQDQVGFSRLKLILERGNRGQLMGTDFPF